MASLVTEVLLQAGKLDKDDLQTKVSKLSARSGEIKAKILNFVEEKLGNFNPMFSSCPVMLRDIQEQQAEAKEIQSALSGVVKCQLQDSTGDFERLTTEHKETGELLFAMENLCKLYDMYGNETAQERSGDYKEAAASLLEIRSILNKIKETDLIEMKVFVFLKNEFVVVYENLIYTLDEKWLSQICWNLPQKDGNLEDIVLKIPCLERSKAPEVKEFHDCILAMSMLDKLKPKIHKFADLVMKHIFTPMIEDHTLLPDLSESEVSMWKISLKKVVGRNSGPVSFSAFFHNVSQVLDCLCKNLLQFGTSNCQENDEKVMTIFSEHIRDEFMQLLIDKCLVMTIPKNKEELEDYKQVEDTVKTFETSLVSIGFLPRPADGELGNKLVMYAMNVSSHFAARRCTDILQQARSLMKKGIQNTERMDQKNVSDVKNIFKTSEMSLAQTNMPLGTDFDSQKPGKLLHDDTMHFPSCQISECAIDIMKLAYKTMSEAHQSDPDCAIRLVTTTQNIFELYQTTFPIYHKDSLENIPRFSAIFFNDCMYLAHHLLTFGHQFSMVSEHAKRAMQVMVFVDKVTMLRQLGAECFLQQLRRQRDMMMQCLEPLRNFATIQGQEKYDTIEKAVKQVLYQLNHLKKVWSEVLPSPTISRALGTLVNSCVAEVVGIICNMEDISADDSISLKQVCELMLRQAPPIFDDSSSTPDLAWRKYVSKWTRLEELIFMLSSSLREIVDRWADGKGPLANAFSTIQVKSLIKALFQNTEHRANAISKIRI